MLCTGYCWRLRFLVREGCLRGTILGFGNRMGRPGVHQKFWVGVGGGTERVGDTLLVFEGQAFPNLSVSFPLGEVGLR